MKLTRVIINFTVNFIKIMLFELTGLIDWIPIGSQTIFTSSFPPNSFLFPLGTTVDVERFYLRIYDVRAYHEQFHSRRCTPPLCLSFSPGMVRSAGLRGWRTATKREEESRRRQGVEARGWESEWRRVKKCRERGAECGAERRQPVSRSTEPGERAKEGCRKVTGSWDARSLIRGIF